MVVTFMTGAGGMGKTSLCYHLGTYLASKEKKVLLIDTDPQEARMTSFLTIPQRKEKGSFYEMIAGEKAIEDIIIPIEENLDVIVSNGDVIESEIVDKNDSKLFCLKNEIDRIKDKYDYIFIDTNPTPTVVHYMCVIASDNIISPVVAKDPKSERGMLGMLKVYDTVKTSFNPDVDILCLVFNEYGGNANLSKAGEIILTRLCRENEIPIAKTKIPSSIKIPEAQYMMKGITEYQPKNAGAEAYRKLSKELFGI